MFPAAKYELVKTFLKWDLHRIRVSTREISMTMVSANINTYWKFWNGQDVRMTNGGLDFIICFKSLDFFLHKTINFRCTHEKNSAVMLQCYSTKPCSSYQVATEWRNGNNNFIFFATFFSIFVFLLYIFLTFLDGWERGR